MSQLSNYTQSKDNNFNLIRIFSALAVLITHSFALATGKPEYEPFRSTLGMTMGSIAVDIFFITSGFLVTASLIRTQSVADFMVSRFLRIYPALIIATLLTVFFLGLSVTSLPVTSYLAKKEIYKFLLKNSTLLFGVEFELPGVFTLNPFAKSVNGSLWTMPYEIRMYGALIAIWLISSLTIKPNLFFFKKIIPLVTAGSFMTLVLLEILGMEKSNLARLTFMFFSGASFYIFQNKIQLRFSALLLCLILLLGGILWGGVVA